jgi:hypothetical protein
VTAFSFIFSAVKEIEEYIQEAVAHTVAAQLAVKIGYNVDISAVMTEIYRNLIRAQEILNNMYEILEKESEREEKQLEDFIELAEDIDPDFYYMELEENVFDPGE